MKPVPADARSVSGFRFYDFAMAAFVAILLLSNVLGAGKVAVIGGEGPFSGFVFGAGILFFPISYVLGDVLTEVYGYARARRCVWAGFAAVLFLALMSAVVVALPPAPGWVPFEYVGNPLLDAVDNHDYKRPVEGNYIALLAGSRSGEIKRMMPVCMEVADKLGCKVVIAGAPARSIEDYKTFIGDRKNVEVIFGRTYDILRYADAAIINSGTASLEAALIGTPQVVCWSTSRLTAFVARNILHVLDNIKYISLGNLCIDKCAFQELIQEDFTAEKVLDEVRRLTGDHDYREKMLDDYADIRQSLGGKGASRAVAKAIIKELL